MPERPEDRKVSEAVGPQADNVFRNWEIGEDMSTENAKVSAPCSAHCYIATRFDGWHDWTMVLTEAELEKCKRDGSFAKEDQFGGSDWRVFRIAEQLPIEQIRGKDCEHEWVTSRITGPEESEVKYDQQ